MKDVFISYKAEEIDQAYWVKKSLEENSISCWMAPDCIKGGSSYAVEIPKAIREVKVFVLLLSSKSQASQWVSKEVDLAISEDKYVLPFMLEDCELKDDFNFYLTNVQRYTAYENKAAAIEKMILEIKQLISKDTEEPEITQEPIPKDETPKIEKKPVVSVDNKIHTSAKPFDTVSLILSILTQFSFLISLFVFNIVPLILAILLLIGSFVTIALSHKRLSLKNKKELIFTIISFALAIENLFALAFASIVLHYILFFVLFILCIVLIVLFITSLNKKKYSN